MSFRDTPITKDCTVLDVMGRRIATSTARKAVVGNDELIEHWQPFQIKGRKVTPCRVALPSTFPAPVLYYMPLINGIPMDDPRASLTGTGDVYLNVRFEFIQEPNKVTVHNYRLVISASSPPNISTTNEGRDLKYTRSIYSSKPYIMTGSGWYSWKIGSIGSVRQNNLRYFSGVGYFPQSSIKPAYKSDIDFSKPIYKKVTYGVDENGDKQWGAVAIEISSWSAAFSISPYEETIFSVFQGINRFNEFEYYGLGTNFPPFTHQATAGLRNVPFGDRPLFQALAVETLYGESP
jgi:hypothetical protein